MRKKMIAVSVEFVDGLCDYRHVRSLPAEMGVSRLLIELFTYGLGVSTSLMLERSVGSLLCKK
jgi:hypothetical protein